MKKCKVCKEYKNLSEFHTHNKCKHGVRPECKMCHNVSSKKKSMEYRKNNPKKRRDTILKSKYGIGIEDYDAMLKMQNGKCKICGSEDPGSKDVFSIDHCHKSNFVRGLLCHGCNIGLGAFKDDIGNLKSAISYLEDYY